MSRRGATGPSGASILSTHLVRRRADRRAARLRRLQHAAAGSDHAMPDRLCEEQLAREGAGIDDDIRVVALGGRLERYGVVADRR